MGIKLRFCWVMVAIAVGCTARGGTPSEQLKHATLRQLEIGEHVILDDFWLGAAGRVALDLERFSVLAPGAQVVEGTAAGDRLLPPSDLVLLRGKVVGEDADSTVFISVGQWGVNGFISRAHGLHWISSGPYVGLLGPEPRVQVTDAAEFTNAMQPFCAYSPDDPRWNTPHEDGLIRAKPLAAPRSTPCNMAVMAVDSDYEFTANLFGGNTSAAADYAMTLMGAVSSIYERDVNVAQYIGYLRVWGTDVDPYGGEGDMGEFLDRFRNHWISNMGTVERVVAHGLSGRPLGGGVAWVNVLCSTAWGYGVSTSLAGSFPLPPTDHRAGNWDPFVVAHEFGHNFGTGHTHDSYDPVIDGCGNGDCSAAWGGTIMSYCHGCPGGMANIVLAFHPRVQEVIEATVANAACFTNLPSGYAALPDQADTLMGVAVTIDVLANDIAQSCGIPSIVGVESPTPGGASVSILTDGEHDRLRYEPAPGFSGTDTFSYTNDGGDTATVTVGVHSFLAADEVIDPQPGVEVDYYLLSSPPLLPDFDTLTPLTSSVVAQVNFPATTGLFADGPLANNVGAVFSGYISAALPALYRFELESDDGSRLFIGGQLVVDNDGLHGMRAVSGVVALLPGLHRVRIEYFENSGEAGLIARYGYTTSSLQVIPATAWFHGQPPACPADVNGDGLLDFFDVSAFLTAFAEGDPTADWLADGRLDFFDVQAFLGDYAAGCP
ncbi:MAG: hypothetical protein Kow0022_00960 [Phycisphaerales bacterium]